MQEQNTKKPFNPQFALKAGEIYLQEQAYCDAEQQFRELLRVMPTDATANYMLAMALAHQHREQEAEDAAKLAVAIEPNFPLAWNLIGTLQGALGRPEKAKEYYLKALSHGCRNPLALWNLSLTELSYLDWEEGWEDYENRFLGGKIPYRYLPPMWDGKQINHLYVWTEQGHGDTLNFLPMLKILRERIPGIEITLEVSEPLVRIATLSGLADTVYLRRDDMSACDYFNWHISLMSLPRVLRLQPNMLPVAERYLNVPPDMVEEWKEKILPVGTNVGVCWCGSGTHANDVFRSIDADEFLDGVDVPGINLISLAKNRKQPRVFDLTDRFTDFLHTAACISALDLVITVDTSIAHLAGALGKEVWILLPKIGDWRWGIEGDPPNWYPTARYFRQAERAEWKPLLSEVKEELAKWLSCMTKAQ